MPTHSKSKYLLIFIIIVVLVGLFYFYTSKKQAGIPTATPYQVVVPKNNPGTVVSLYKTVPDGFPSEVILESSPLTYSGAIQTAQGQIQMKVSYQSSKTILDLVDFYKTTLTKNGWTVHENSVNSAVANFTVSKAGTSVLVTVVPAGQTKGAKIVGSLVTFQYQK